MARLGVVSYKGPSTGCAFLHASICRAFPRVASRLVALQLSYLPMQPALLFAATLLPLLRSNTVGTSLQTPDRLNLDRIGSKKKRGQRGHEQERNVLAQSQIIIEA